MPKDFLKLSNKLNESKGARFSNYNTINTVDNYTVSNKGPWRAQIDFANSTHWGAEIVSTKPPGPTQNRVLIRKITEIKHNYSKPFYNPSPKCN